MQESKKVKGRKMEIEGVLTALDWDDDDDEPIELAIITDDDVEYTIAMNGLGQELIPHVDGYVIARGNLVKNPEGDDVFVVSWFDVEDNFDDEDFDDDDD